MNKLYPSPEFRARICCANKSRILAVTDILGQNFFIGWFTNPPTVIFRKVENKNSKIIFLNLIRRLKILFV